MDKFQGYLFRVKTHCYCVMYGSAGLLALFYLGLSRGVMSHIYIFICGLYKIHCDTQCSSLGSFIERDNMTNRYKIFTFITTIIFYPYNSINIIHKYTLNCKDFLLSSSSSRFSNVV